MLQNKQSLSRGCTRLSCFAVVCAALLTFLGCGSSTGSFFSSDSDQDGLSDQTERLLGTDPQNADSDFDGVLDGDELQAGTSPLAFDSDRDGISDGDDNTIDVPSRRFGSISSGNDVEPNDHFNQAVVLANNGSNNLTLQGRIDRIGDVDVFDLGPLHVGDLLRVDFIRQDQQFRASVAAFDKNGYLFHAGLDPFSGSGPDLNGLLFETVRHDSSRYFLGVTHPGDDFTLGAYQLNVTIQRNTQSPTLKPQIVLLDFDGGVLDRTLLGIRAVNAFDTGNISPEYQGDTDLIKQTIIRVVKEKFSGYQVDIYTSDDPPTADHFTTLLFGSFSEHALGASESVDVYNADCCDDGVVFTESFTPSIFGFTPRVSALGKAIAQVAAHEIGHLLGLHHVNDVDALMDESSPASYLLFDQHFSVSPLSDSVFSIGWQDAPAMLDETVGSR